MFVCATFEKLGEPEDKAANVPLDKVGNTSSHKLHSLYQIDRILTPSNNVESDCKLLLGWSFEEEPSNDDATGDHPTQTGEKKIEDYHTECSTYSRHLRPIDTNDENNGGEE